MFYHLHSPQKGFHVDSRSYTGMKKAEGRAWMVGWLQFKVKVFAKDLA